MVRSTVLTSPTKIGPIYNVIVLVFSVSGGDQKVLRVSNPAHLRTIRGAVWEARSVWRRLGGELGLTPGDLDAIELDQKDSGAKLGKVLEKWMYTGKATTYDLIYALQANTVGMNTLANEILAHENAEDAANYGF